jgi:hypothetical protein
MVMLQWKDDGGSWEHRAYWGDNLWPHSEDSPVRRRFMGRLPDAPGWTRLETPALWVGLEGRGVHGMSFVLYDGTAAFDHVGKVVPAVDTVWLSGKLPPGAQTEPGGGESWQWITNGLPPFAGRLAHFSPPAAGYRQHQFTGGTQGWKVGPDESLFCWVHMDPGNPPSMVALLWQDNGGSWEHRAFWGADNLPAGTRGTAGRRHAGPLPPGDEWIRLSVPATLVGLENKVVTGLGFGLHDGTALWLDAGKASPDSAFPPGGLLNARLLPEGYFRIILFGRPQERYALMSSSNMVDWRQSKTVTILESGQAAAYFPSDQPQRFFRALLQQ